MPRGVKPGSVAKGTRAHDGAKRCGGSACVYGWAMQPVGNFHRAARESDGLCTRCKDCQARDHKARWPKRAERRKAQTRAWSRAEVAEYPGLKNSRRSQLLGKYGLTPDDYLDIFCKQNGCCEICRQPFGSLWLNPIDHCHQTQRVCGLLCCGCNTAIGKLHESSAMLNRAADYVRTRKESA